MKAELRFVLLFFLAGCATQPTVVDKGEQPVRYADRVQIARADVTPRAVTTQMEIISQHPETKHHVIARLSIEGNASDEGMLVNALAWQARQLGAKALLILSADSPYQAWNSSGHERGRRIFRADAIVFDDQ